MEKNRAAALLVFVFFLGQFLQAGTPVFGPDWSRTLKCKDWAAGGAEWQSFDATVSHVDWRGYDRFSVKVAYDGPTDGSLSVYVGGRGPHQYETTSLRPCSWRTWTFKLSLPDKVDPAAVKVLHFFTSRPRGGTFYFADAVLLKPGETVPTCDPAADAQFAGSLRRMLAEQMEEKDGVAGELEELKAHVRAFLDFREACAAAGQKGGMLLGKATSMERIRPRSGLERPLKPADVLKVRLARREYESVQLVVCPRGSALSDVSVSVGELSNGQGATFKASNVMVGVMGYVRIKGYSPYRTGRGVRRGGETKRECVRAERGWYPEPILSYTNSAPVAEMDMQSFWIRFRADADQPAGTYRGQATVSARGEETRTVPVEVTVYPFELPVAPPLPTAITWGPEYHPPTAEDKGFYKRIDSPRTPVRLWSRHKREWVDFLSDYYITMDSIYKKPGGGLDIDTFRRLKGLGRLGPVNLGFWVSFKDAAGEASWRATTLAGLKKAYAELKDAGLADHAYAYGCDEMPEHLLPRMRRAIEILKEEMPGVPLATTAYDTKLGVGSPLEAMDWFIPLTSKYDAEKAAASRRAGHKVWWYISCVPHAPYANMFVDSQAIEARLLHGAMAVRMRPDGFLIYEIAIWNAKKGISGGPFTDWDPRTWRNYNGDGCWTCTDAEGRPLPTVRLENYRDGVEDFAYAAMLERLAAERGGDDGWRRAAAEALKVPCGVMKSMTDYTDDPAEVYGWRDRMAELISSLEKPKASLPK